MALIANIFLVAQSCLGVVLMRRLATLPHRSFAPQEDSGAGGSIAQQRLCQNRHLIVMDVATFGMVDDGE